MRELSFVYLATFVVSGCSGPDAHWVTAKDIVVRDCVVDMNVDQQITLGAAVELCDTVVVPSMFNGDEGRFRDTLVANILVDRRHLTITAPVDEGDRLVGGAYVVPIVAQGNEPAIRVESGSLTLRNIRIGGQGDEAAIRSKDELILEGVTSPFDEAPMVILEQGSNTVGDFRPAHVVAHDGTTVTLTGAQIFEHESIQNEPSRFQITAETVDIHGNASTVVSLTGETRAANWVVEGAAEVTVTDATIKDWFGDGEVGLKTVGVPIVNMSNSTVTGFEHGLVFDDAGRVVLDGLVLANNGIAIKTDGSAWLGNSRSYGNEVVVQAANGELSVFSHDFGWDDLTGISVGNGTLIAEANRFEARVVDTSGSQSGFVSPGVFAAHIEVVQGSARIVNNEFEADHHPMSLSLVDTDAVILHNTLMANSLGAGIGRTNSELVVINNIIVGRVEDTEGFASNRMSHLDEDAARDNYHIDFRITQTGGDPAIPAGVSTRELYDVTLDIDGVVRPWEDPAIGPREG